MTGWSDEARAAALEARRRKAKQKIKVTTTAHSGRPFSYKVSRNDMARALRKTRSLVRGGYLKGDFKTLVGQTLYSRMMSTSSALRRRRAKSLK
jgi:hypothetical protein